MRVYVVRQAAKFLSQQLLEAIPYISIYKDPDKVVRLLKAIKVPPEYELRAIVAGVDGLEEKRKNHAKFTARNQIGNFNSLTTKIRAQNLGITQAIWRTSRDERVRPCHKVRDGKAFDLATGLYSSCDGLSLLPGVDFQCRCDYELVIPEDDEG